MSISVYDQSISIYPSVVTLPCFDEHNIPLVLNFLCARFPMISRDIWQERIELGKVLDGNYTPLTSESLCVPHGKIHYFREVDSELVIPFKESIIFQNDHLLVADKPHFLPVIPGGSYVNESLLNRLKTRTANSDLVPIHRIDRETAGLVLFSVEKRSRGIYQKMFMEGRVRKTYIALTHWPDETGDDSGSCRLSLNNGYLINWVIKKRIVKGEPWFRMKIEENGKTNSVTRMEIVDIIKSNTNTMLLNNTPMLSGIALLRLFPETGKKHQLRLHLSSVGCPIIHDRLYPELLPESPPDFAHPLQLVAQRLEFNDPVSGTNMDFVSSFTINI